MIQRRPSFCATAPVVPLPANESSTRSPGFVAIPCQQLKRLCRMHGRSSLCLR